MVEKLEAACLRGNTSCFTSGIDPGFANDARPITLLGRLFRTLCRRRVGQSWYLRPVGRVRRRGLGRLARILSRARDLPSLRALQRNPARAQPRSTSPRRPAHRAAGEVGRVIGIILEFMRGIRALHSIAPVFGVGFDRACRWSLIHIVCPHEADTDHDRRAAARAARRGRRNQTRRTFRSHSPRGAGVPATAPTLTDRGGVSAWVRKSSR